MAMILAGDIGGTTTRLALFENQPECKMAVEANFSSRAFPHLLPMVQEFLGRQKTAVEHACFGIAGPVQGGRCKATNLPWVVESSELAHGLGIESVFLLNDLEANAWGLRVLEPDDFYLLHTGLSNQRGNAALIAAGTGLGEAGLFWDGRDYHPFACEGGHTDFAPRDALEIELFTYLKKLYPSHLSYERIISGPGLHSLYQFLIETERETESPVVKREMAARDPPAVISEWAQRGEDPACARAIKWFLSLYGGEAGNLALKFLALGGVYIGGGIAPHLFKQFEGSDFMSSFSDKGRFKPLLETIPVRIVLNDRAALLGAAQYAYLHSH